MSSSRKFDKWLRKLIFVSLLFYKITSFRAGNLFSKISLASKSLSLFSDRFSNSRFYKFSFKIIRGPYTLDRFRILKFLSENSSYCSTIGCTFGWISLKFKAFTYNFSLRPTMVLIFWSNLPKFNKIL